MISVEESKALFSLLNSEQSSFDEVMSDFSSKFLLSLHFRICTAFATLLELKESLPNPKKHGKINSTKVDGSSTEGKGILISKESEALAEPSMDSKTRKNPEVTSFLLCNRVRVYSYVPDVANLPQGGNGAANLQMGGCEAGLPK